MGRWQTVIEGVRNILLDSFEEAKKTHRRRVTSWVGTGFKFNIYYRSCIKRTFMMSWIVNIPLRNQERPLRLQEDFLETHRRLGISQAARALKIDTDLPGCILGTSIMSKTTKTPLRNPQRPLRLQGWHLDDALENPGVGQLSMKVEIWKLICSFIDIYKRHPLYQKPPRLLSGTSSVLLDSLDEALENPAVRPLSRKVELPPLK